MICRQNIWDGLIPTQVTLSESDLASDIILDPYHIMLPRISYLTLAASDVIDYFKQDAVDVTTNIWFEFEGKILKGHLPIGVLFDLYSNQVIPWKITLHFREMKIPQVVKLNNLEDVSKYYYHSIKQATHILIGNTRLFTSLSIKKHEQLVESISTGNASLFESILSELQSLSFIPRAIPLRVTVDEKPLLQRPVRIYRPSSSSLALSNKNDNIQQSMFSQGKMNSRLEDRTRSSSRSVSAAESESTTIQQIISETSSSPTSPSNEEQESKINNSNEIQDEENNDSSLRYKEEIIEDENDHELVTLQDIYNELFPNTSYRILIHGIEIPLEAPILEVWRKFCYPDLFLYLTVVL